MAVKLLPLSSSTKIHRWVTLASRFSSVQCAADVEFPSGSARPSPKAREFDAKIKFLRDRLIPDNFIQVLDSTADVESAVKLFEWASLQKGFRHTADTYGKMILKLGMSGNIQEMEGFCRTMIKSGCTGAEDACVLLVHKFAEHDRLDEAIRVIVNMIIGGHKPSAELFDLVLGRLVETKRDLRDFMYVYKEMVKAGRVPNVEILNYLLEALFEADFVDPALNQYRRMNKKGCTPNSRTFEVVVKNLIEKGRVGESVAVLHEMVDLKIELSISFYTCVVPLLFREDQVEMGMRLFNLMRAANLTPDPRIYSVVVHHLCSKLLLDDATDLVEGMTDCGVTPLDDVFRNMVSGFCRLGKLDEAMKFLEDKQVIAASAHNALLDGCCNAGEIFLAKRVLEQMSENNIDDSDSWNILIRWLCEHSRLKEAFVFLGQMITSSLTPDHSTYSALIRGHCKLNMYKDALNLFYKLCDKSWVLESVSYCELIEGLCHGVWIQEAAEVFRYMANKRHPLRSSSFEVLIKGICESSGVEEAMKLRSLAYESGTYFTSNAYSVILRGLARAKNNKYLLAVLALLLVEGCTISVETYHILISSISSQGRVQEAALLFDLMVDSGLSPKPDSLIELISVFVESSQLVWVNSAVDRLLMYCENVDAQIYCLLINGFWKEGNKAKARALLDLMLEKGWVPDAKTHGLLMGSGSSEEAFNRILRPDHSALQDTVTDILSEGLKEA